MAGYTIESSAYFNSQYGRFCHWEEPQSKGYPNPTLRHAIQDILKKLKRYSGPVDGVWGLIRSRRSSTHVRFPRRKRTAVLSTVQ